MTITMYHSETEKDEEVLRRLIAAGRAASDTALRIAIDRQTRVVAVADDGNAEVEYDAESLLEAAQEYVDGGDWGEVESTTWIRVRAWWRYYVGSECVDDESSEGSFTIAVDPDEPECVGGEHDWQSPHELLGGLKENPGVWGHGGGVICSEVCMECGCERTTDTWAQDPETGEQGLTQVSYEVGKYADEVAALEEEEEEEPDEADLRAMFREKYGRDYEDGDEDAALVDLVYA